MQSIPLHQIQVIDRQRQEISPKKLDELKRGILSKGLLHAIVLSKNEDGTLRLRAGERRLKAITTLHEEAHTVYYNSEPIPTDHIPYVLTTELSEDDLFELELEENLLRENLTWMEECEARAKLHELRKTQNPGQTVSQTSAEIANVTELEPVTERKKLQQALLITSNKENPKVKKAKNANEAFKALLDEQEQLFRGKLALAEKQIETPHQLIHADCREAFEKIENGSVSTILCDPPYGIDANKAGQQSKHFYNDSADYALDVCKFILREGFKKCTPRAVLFMFCDIDQFVTLRTYASQQAWTVFRTPIIWDKQVGGSAPWGKAGFKRSYEILLFAVKGQDELIAGGINDILSFKQSSRADRTHAANKPVELLEHLIRISTLPGELVLDPCCGSGSIFPAATRAKVRAIGIELDDVYHSQAVARLHGEEPLQEPGDEEGSALDSVLGELE